MTSIELKNITATHKGKEVLSDVSMTITDGEYIGLLGPTGSGPSFILKTIAGLQKIETGSIFINGKDMTDKPPEDRNVGYVFEQFNLFPHLSVIDNLLYGPRMRDENIEEKQNIAKEIISMVRLDGREGAISRELSGGMKQRTGVARAVTSGADILLLDQPYRALDAKIRTELRFEIRELARELGLTTIHSTHETEEAMITSDRIAVFNQGKLEQIDTPTDLFNNPSSRFVAQFLAESNVLEGSISNNNFEWNGIKIELEKGDYNPGPYTAIIPQQSIRLSDEPIDGNNVFDGVVVKTRLLGEFIRFSVKMQNGEIITVRELLSLERKNFINLLNSGVHIRINPGDINIFKGDKSIEEN